MMYLQTIELEGSVGSANRVVVMCHECVQLIILRRFGVFTNTINYYYYYTWFRCGCVVGLEKQKKKKKVEGKE